MTQRAQDLGIIIGQGTPGPLNAITDVPGVRVGHATRDEPGWLTGTSVVVPPVGTTGGVDVRGGGRFPVHRIYCVGRNFADHAREMGAVAPASKAERGTPVFFMKPADAIVTAAGEPQRAVGPGGDDRGAGVRADGIPHRLSGAHVVPADLAAPDQREPQSAVGAGGHAPSVPDGAQ